AHQVHAQLLRSTVHERNHGGENKDFHDKSRAMTVSQEMPRALTRSCAAFPILRAAWRSTYNASNASAMARGSGGTTRPLIPSWMNSSVPPESVSVTVQRIACAASIVG